MAQVLRPRRGKEHEAHLKLKSPVFLRALQHPCAAMSNGNRAKRQNTQSANASASYVDPGMDLDDVVAIANGSDSDGESILAKVQRIADSQREEFAKSQELVVSTITAHVDRKTAKLERGFLQHEERLGSVESKQTQFEARQAALEAKQEEFSRQLLLAQKAGVEREDLAGDAFDRPANLEVIRVSTRQFVTLDAVRTAITPWMGDTVAIDPESWKLVAGTPVGKGFVIKFLLSPIQNARAVNAAMGKLKNDEGEYLEFHARAADSSEVKLRLDRDENHRARTMRRMAMSMVTALKSQREDIPNIHFRRNQRKGMVSVFGDRTPIATMDPETPTIVEDSFKWNYLALANLEIDRPALVEKTLELLEDPTEAVEWRL